MTTPGRVAFLMPYLSRGGIERSLVNVLTELAKTHDSLDLVVGHADEDLLQRIPSNVRIIRLEGGLPLIGRLIQPMNSTALGMLPAIVRYLRAERPSVLMSFQSHAVVVAARFLARSNTRLIIRESNTPTAAFSRRSVARRSIALRLKSFTYARADAILAISEGVGEDLVDHLRVPHEKINVVYNPASTAGLPKLMKEDVAHPWFQEVQSTPVIIGVGRIADQKDFETLVRGFAIARSKEPCRLVILGDGNLRPELEQLIQQLGISDSTAILGYVQNPYKYMARASFFALSPRYEGLGNVFIEALACGLPVISTDCPSGPREILLDGAGGLLVPVGDYEALSDAMLSYLRDPERAHTLCDKGRSGLDRFQADVSARRYGEVIAHVAK
jgi:glycosyltransferase involved in cell wall biosynthesis